MARLLSNLNSSLFFQAVLKELPRFCLVKEFEFLRCMRTAIYLWVFHLRARVYYYVHTHLEFSPFSHQSGADNWVFFFGDQERGRRTINMILQKHFLCFTLSVARTYVDGRCEMDAMICEQINSRRCCALTIDSQEN